MSGLLGKFGEERMQMVTGEGNVIGVIDRARDLYGHDECRAISRDGKFTDQGVQPNDLGSGLRPFAFASGIWNSDAVEADREFIHLGHPFAGGLVANQHSASGVGGNTLSLASQGTEPQP